jgi:hypothetical protein
LWVALVDFLPMIGGALAGIPTVLFTLGHSFTAGIITAAAFIAYQQIENHVLNPVVMSRTVKINSLLVLLSILVGTSIGSWLGSFVAALLSIPVAGALRVIARELWQITGRPERAEGERAAGPQPSITDQQKSGPHRELYDGGRQADEDIAAPLPDATPLRLARRSTRQAAGRPCLRFVVLPQLLGTLAVQTASRFRSTAVRAGVDVAWIDPAAEAFPGPLEVTAMASVFDDER